jgi:hypothetical protein
VLLNAVDDLLKHLPIDYHVRIDTAAGAVLQRNRAAVAVSSAGVEREVV